MSFLAFRERAVMQLSQWLESPFTADTLALLSNAPVKANPSTIVITAAMALARFHKIPTVNTTANGGAMKKKTVLIFSKSVVDDRQRHRGRKACAEVWRLCRHDGYAAAGRGCES